MRSRKTRDLIVLAVSLAVVFGARARADIINVPGDFPTIQEAIVAASDGDEVIVAPGTYFETINFLGKAIVLQSSDGPDVTIIDAQQTGTVVTCDSAEGPGSALEGFTITGGNADSGGGMLNSTSNATVTNCTFSGNSAGVGGGGMDNEGGSPTVTNCTFSGNWGSIWGGGMSNSLSSPTVTNCTFAGNATRETGGGMYNEVSNPTVSNCTFSGNSAAMGGGMYNYISSSPTVTNCTFSGNWGSLWGGGMSNSLSSPTVTNCILWGDIPDEIAGTAAVRYSVVQNGWPGIGNIDVDPMFVAPGIGDSHLMVGSPCIDAGNNWGVPIDENDYDMDGVLCELFPVDLDGNPRFNADETDLDPGCGIPVVVDMGAYEYQFDPVDQVTFADLNGDNAVGAADLLGLLASWGSCGKGCCLADLDIDGNVGASDLLALLANWGACP